MIVMRKNSFLEDKKLNISYDEEKVVFGEGDKTLSLKRTNKNAIKILECILGKERYEKLPNDDGDEVVDLDDVGKDMFEFMHEQEENLRTNVEFWVEAMDSIDLERTEFVKQLQAKYIADHMIKE